MHPNPTPAGPARPRLADGFAALRENRIDAAVALRDQWLSSHADDAEVRFFAAEVGAFTGELEGALDHIEIAIAKAPGQWPLVLKKARLLRAMRRRDAFRATAEEAARLAQPDPRATWEVANALLIGGETLAARPLLEMALAGGPDVPGLRLNLASAQFFTGEFDAAEATLEPAIRRDPTLGDAIHLRSTLRRQTPERNHIRDLRTRLAAAGSNPGLRAAIHYALAKELEDLGEDAASFASLSEGAALKRATLDYDAAAERAVIDELREGWTAEAMAGVADGHDETGPIFIVGMPRTGTTLVERMLDRHPRVRSAGELMDFKQVLAAAVRRRQDAHPGETPVQASLRLDFAALGRDYIGGAREAAHGSPFFIDKMPVNFLYCGLLLKALPNARIVHLVRHPLDAGYAVFKTLFNQAYFFSYDQIELADYLVTYHRMMAHWHAVMPGRILDLHYEDLVTRTEAQARRLLEWCGLDWNDTVLAPDRNPRPSTTASAAQVREPVHAASVARWRRVESGLAPLRARLADVGVIGADGALLLP